MQATKGNIGKLCLKGEGFSGTSIKDTWTKPKGDRIKGGKWRWLGWGGSSGGEIETTVLEQQLKKKNQILQFATTWMNLEGIVLYIK